MSGPPPVVNRRFPGLEIRPRAPGQLSRSQARAAARQAREAGDSREADTQSTPRQEHQQRTEPPNGPAAYHGRRNRDGPRRQPPTGPSNRPPATGQSHTNPTPAGPALRLAKRDERGPGNSGGPGKPVDPVNPVNSISPGKLWNPDSPGPANPRAARSNPLAAPGLLNLPTPLPPSKNYPASNTGAVDGDEYTPVNTSNVSSMTASMQDSVMLESSSMSLAMERWLSEQSHQGGVRWFKG
ncbi:hypothetical protein BZA77DRAFT_108049 [Pyronema omphalodes]|nr:hypothetical protein BZA77DRAFT_108049 [Pyronema omphalodes]